MDIDWDRDVEKIPVTCPRCGRNALQLSIEKWGISPIACDWCADEWERNESERAGNTRAAAFAASGIPEWTAVLEPDTATLGEFMHDMGSRGVRAMWIQRDNADSATRDACAILRAWMESRTELGAYRTGAYVVETAVYSKEGIGAAANADLLVIDGFGRRAPSRYEAGRLRELLEKRRIERKPVIIATTLGPGRAGDTVGQISSEGIAAMDCIMAMVGGAV